MTLAAPSELALSARPLPIELRVTKSEIAFVELLNWLARHNERLLLERPDLPGLYDSGVVYERETPAVWCYYLSMLEQGLEVCDWLAAARAAFKPVDQPDLVPLGAAHQLRVACGAPFRLLYRLRLI